MKVILN